MIGLPIALKGQPVLRARAEEVDVIGKPELQELACNMLDTYWRTFALGVAAPQVFHSLRLFVTSLPLAGLVVPKVPAVVINPTILKVSEEMVWGEEGCLSIPDVFRGVMRPRHITVQYYSRRGKRIVRDLSGIFARIFLHEHDHLDGVLFTDKR